MKQEKYTNHLKRNGKFSNIAKQIYLKNTNINETPIDLKFSVFFIIF